MNAAEPATRTRPVWFGAAHAEVVKLWSLWSNRILMAVAVLMIAGSGTLLAVSTVGRLTDPRFAGQTVVATPMMFVDSVLWAQVIIAILAVLSVSGEYTSGQIRLSLLAVPTRLPWLGAKAGVLALIAFAIGSAGSAVSLTVSSVVVAGTDVDYALALPEALALSAGSGLYLAAIALLAIGVACALRHVVAALMTVLALLVVAPPILASLPHIGWLADYAPTIAGRRLISAFDSTAQLGPWAGFGVLLVWAVGACLVAGALLKSRDT